MKSRFFVRPSLSIAACGLLVGSFAVVSAFGQEVNGAPPAVVHEGPLSPASVTKQRCTVRQDEHGWWLVAPSGERFFSLGICMFNQGQHRDEYDPTKPSYAAFRHYDVPQAWADASLERIKSWGFTTIGGWSDYHVLPREQQNLWLTPVLHMGSTSGVPWFDMWDEKV